MAAMGTPTDEDIRELAQRRVAFRTHALVYVLVNVFLVALWAVTTGLQGFYWPVWTHVGWGIGLAFHAYGVFGPRGDAVAREEAKLRKKYGRGP